MQGSAGERSRDYQELRNDKMKLLNLFPLQATHPSFRRRRVSGRSPAIPTPVSTSSWFPTSPLPRTPLTRAPWCAGHRRFGHPELLSAGQPSAPLQNLATFVHLHHWWARLCDPLDLLSQFYVPSESLVACSPGDLKRLEAPVSHDLPVRSCPEEEEDLLVLRLDPCVLFKP
jgi:hypothetical protein